MSYIHKNMLLDCIKHAFRTEVGKNQIRVPERQGTGESREAPQKALHIRFRTQTDYSTEEGYRYLDLVIYAPMNYVQVWVRKSWNVIPNHELVDDGNGDTVIAKSSPGYREGSDPWELIADHDSCWPSGVESVLKNEFGELSGFDTMDGWYKIAPVASFNLPEK